MAKRRGVILPTVLVVLLLLGVLGAMFSFRVNADLAATRAMATKVQCRLAAEAGLDVVIQMLRIARDDMDFWYHNPDDLHRILIWANNTDPSDWGTNQELEEGALAFRFSIVADDPTDDEDIIRIGVTDESAKLNLNLATEAQLLVLVEAAVAGDPRSIPQEIVEAILDWRDADSKPRGETQDTEGVYYQALDPPYRVKNGLFDTVEELLLVKGVTERILYGEDFDRNGLLSANEDDGRNSFPLDNEDGFLDRGLYPYLTVYSVENNVRNDNRPRIFLLGEENDIRPQLEELFGGATEIVDYVVQVTRAQGPGTGGNENGAGNADNGDAGQGGSDQPPPDGSTGEGDDDDDGKQQPRQQRRQRDPEDEESGEESSDSPVQSGNQGDENPADQRSEEGQESNDVPAAAGPIRSPASLLLPRSISGEIRTSPIGKEYWADLMDGTTILPPDQRELPGLINLNTAPALVLRCIDGLSEEQIEGIVGLRDLLDADTKSTTAWVVEEDVVDLETFERIAPFVTARGRQFTIESLGYADHVGMVARLQVIVDLLGPIPQAVYYRDLTHLGAQFPIRQEDAERLRVR